jgi:hypothetical protein
LDVRYCASCTRQSHMSFEKKMPRLDDKKSRDC